MTITNYYSQNRAALIKQFEGMVRLARPLLTQRYGAALADRLAVEGRREFVMLLPTLPEIGGKTNPLTWNLLGAAWMLALYKAMKSEGITLGEIVDVTLALFQAYLHRYPRWLLRLLGWLYTHGLWRWRMQRLAARSQKREYPDDWVLTYVPGDGQTFSDGVNFTQCAICKLCRDHGAQELLPHLCKVDFVECDAMGIDLKREHTLAAGDALCDFRIRARA